MEEWILDLITEGGIGAALVLIGFAASKIIPHVKDWRRNNAEARMIETRSQIEQREADAKLYAEAHATTIHGLIEEVNRLRDKVEELTGEVNRLRMVSDKNQQEYINTLTELAEAKADNRKLKSEHHTLLDDHGRLKKQLAKAEDRAEQAEHRISELEKEVADLEQRLAKYEKEHP